MWMMKSLHEVQFGMSKEIGDEKLIWRNMMISVMTNKFVRELGKVKT